MNKFKWTLGVRQGVAVNCVGRSGGLARWWRDVVDVTVRPWSQYFIDAEVKFEGKSFRFTGIYGEPWTYLRKKTWDALAYLRRQNNLPWLCAGNFNVALTQVEQLGGSPRNLKQMEDFKDCLDMCALADMGFSGYPFTWDNNKEDGENVQVRLDRATCNNSFMAMFPNNMVENIIIEESDRMAILILQWRQL